MAKKICDDTSGLWKQNIKILVKECVSKNGKLAKSVEILKIISHSPKNYT